MPSRPFSFSDEALSTKLLQMIRDHLEDLHQINRAMTDEEYVASTKKCLDIIQRTFDAVVVQESILAIARRKRRGGRPLTGDQALAGLQDLLEQGTSPLAAKDSEDRTGGNQSDSSQAEQTGSGEKKDGDE